MLQVARLAPKLLGDSAALVASFLRSRLAPGGGFMNREDKADLYYTVFGVEGLLALQQVLPREELLPWLRAFGDGAGLDFVHLCCLARCWAAVGIVDFPVDQRAGLVARLEGYRTRGGGYHPATGRELGSAYGCLLATAAYEDVGMAVPDADGVHGCMESLRNAAGAWTNEAGLPLGIAPASAAAMSLYRRMGWSVPREAVAWLSGCCLPAGGFVAFPNAPIPDLLSTAVSLHGLAGMEADLRLMKEPCLDFVDSLWSAEGGFHGNWTDDALDCEYTYYGLLALGHLSL
jgi:hypothetical protein